MRPDPSDLLAGVQSLLTQDLVPALGDTPYLQEQATMASLLLEQVKQIWPRLHLSIAAEHDDLRATVERLRDEARECEDPRLRASVEPLAAAAERGAAANVATHALTEVLEADRALRAALVLWIRALRDFGSQPSPASPADGEQLSRARGVADAYLVRFAARQRELVSGLGLGW